MQLNIRIDLAALRWPNLRLVPLLYLTLILLIGQHFAEARFKRCFTCRSRGPLGDCRDPFTLNSTTFDGQTNTQPSLEAGPCASGWCAKIIEDDFSESIKATERSCMTRPPTDNEERCTQTIFENRRDRKVFLCMCYGDLCNTAATIRALKPTFGMTLIGIFIIKYYHYYYYCWHFNRFYN